MINIPGAEAYDVPNRSGDDFSVFKLHVAVLDPAELS